MLRLYKGDLFLTYIQWHFHYPFAQPVNHNCIALTTATCATWKSTGTARTATVTGLTKNKAYYWQVRAKNAAGMTLASGSLWSFKTAP